MKASLEGDSRLEENIVTFIKEVKVSESDESLNRGGRASSTNGNDKISLQNSIRGSDENGQAAPIAGHDLRQSVTSLKGTFENEKAGEELKGLFATPSYVSQSSTPLKETSEDEEAGEELKGMFATPSFVSQSMEGQPSDLRSPLSGEAMTRGESLGSCRKENVSESVGAMVEWNKILVTAKMDLLELTKEKYQQMLQEQTLSQSDIVQLQAYYKAVGGEKKRRVYGLGFQAISYKHIINT